MDLITLSSERLDCSINLFGAELHTLSSKDGREWLWEGDPVYWSGRAPVLFPIVGALAGGVYDWGGWTYALEKHGFARRRAFTLVESDESSATLRLSADDATRDVYPFEFALDLHFALADSLTVSARVRNHGAGAMPFSFGFHPALRWPRFAPASVIFKERESGPVWRIDGAGLIARHEPLPGDGRTLALDDRLFAEDAMILRGVASRGVRFDHGEGSVRVAWENLPDLGLWTKPGAPFLCIEPWAGYSDDVGFSGELNDKAGIVVLAPGASWAASMTIDPR